MQFTDVMPLTGEYEPSPFEFSRSQVERYEASDGKDGTELEGKPVVIIVSVGASSGKLRKSPVMRVEHNGVYAAVASKAGAPEHPAWYHNLKKNPLVEVWDGTTKVDRRARETTDAERSLWWDRALEIWPDYDSYAAATDREIPVFVLEPTS